MRFFFVFVLLLLGKILTAQSDFDQNQQKLYSYFYSKQYKNAKELIDNSFLNSNQTTQKIIGLVYLADYYFHENNQDLIVESLEEAKNLANKSKDDIDQAYVSYGYARYYLMLKQNELFVKSLNHAIEVFSQKENENFILTQLYYLNLKYKLQNLLEKDIRYDCVQANEHAIKSKNNLLISFTYNNLAYYYKGKYDELNETAYLDSAKLVYNKAIEFGNLIEDNSSKKRTLIVSYLNQRLTSSNETPTPISEQLSNYQKALELAKSDQSVDDLQSHLYNNIGFTYDQLGNKQLAEENYLKAFELEQNNPSILAVYRIKTLNNLSNFYAGIGNYNKAFQYERLSKILIEEENQKQFDQNTKALELFYETEKKNLTINQLEEKNKGYLKQTILLVSVFVLTLLGGLFMYFWLKSRLKINQQKTDILEAEKKQAELILELEQKEKEQLKINQELLALRQEHLEKQALATSLHLDQKSKFLDELKEKLAASGINLDKMLKEDQILESEFGTLNTIIEQIHPSFFKKLHHYAKTKLTSLDLKYASFIYLNMDNQQIANILKAEPNTVRTTKYRLKQKLGLSKEDDLHLFLQDLIS